MFNYNKKTGELTWAYDWNYKSKKGELAGFFDPVLKTRTICIYVKGRKVYLKVHRVIYYMHHKRNPLIVDHINGNPLDNRIENLRSCTQQQNTWNSKLSKNNKSGHSGVWFCKRHNNWIAYITINYKKKHIGCFAKKEDAILARKRYEEKMWGQYSHEYGRAKQ